MLTHLGQKCREMNIWWLVGNTNWDRLLEKSLAKLNHKMHKQLVRVTKVYNPHTGGLGAAQ